jgi:predicted nucleic-acid-binding Zn-ribbon protein
MKKPVQGSEKRMEREAISSIPPATCSICGGTEIIYAESELNIVKPYLTARQEERQEQDSNRKIDYMKMGMNVLVCTDCGHSVFYAREPNKLKNKREETNS